jgi:hypothetical protein
MRIVAAVAFYFKTSPLYSLEWGGECFINGHSIGEGSSGGDIRVVVICNRYTKPLLFSKSGRR